MEPFRIINRDLSMPFQDTIYMVECEKYNSERDTFIYRMVFLDFESAREYQMELWESELKSFSQFTDWSSTSIPPGKTVQDYVRTRAHTTWEYIGWDTDAIIADSIMSDDDLSEMNWDRAYGLTMGYSVLILKWKADKNRYG